MKRGLLAGGAVVGVAIVAFLAFGVFGVHTAFVDDEVDEGGPVFASGAGASGLPSDELTEEVAADMTDRAEELDLPAEDPVEEEMPMPEVEIVTLAEGTFVDRSHPTSGSAVVLNDGSEQRFLRLADFVTDNGPDLNVYLTTADAGAEASAFGVEGEYVDLGDLQGNIGNQNYEIPVDVDLDRFDTVVIWCVRFGVAFGAADLG